MVGLHSPITPRQESRRGTPWRVAGNILGAVEGIDDPAGVDPIRTAAEMVAQRDTREDAVAHSDDGDLGGDVGLESEVRVADQVDPEEPGELPVSAGEAIQMLEAGPARDVVVTDHAIPQMTGTELAAIIRAEYPHIEVIVASGYAELPDGADKEIRRLQKPFSQKQLNDAILSTQSS